MAVRGYNIAEVKSDLYARIPSNGEMELLLGENAINDSLPSWWQYDQASMATDDFANGVIQPTLQTGAGRWIRYNVAMTLPVAMASLATKMDIPTGSALQYIAGDGSFVTFPAGFSGVYSDLTGKPTLFSGAYADLTGLPTIPTNTNQLTNGSGFLTSVPAQTWASITGKPTIKRTETFTGTTNASGVYTITYGTAFSSVPNVNPQLGVGATNKETIVMTASSTTGCSFKVETRNDVLGLLPTYANVNGRTVTVLVTE